MCNKAAPVCKAGVLTRLNGLIKGIIVNHFCGCLAVKACPTLWPLAFASQLCSLHPPAGPVRWIQANKLLDHPDGNSGWGNRLKQGWSIVCCNSVCGWSHFVSLEAVSSSWLQADMKGKKIILCVFHWSHFTSTYNLFRGKKKKATAAVPFVSPLSHQKHSGKEANWNKETTGTNHRKKYKSADLIRLPCLSLTKWVYSLPPEQEGAPAGISLI